MGVVREPRLRDEESTDAVREALRPWELHDWNVRKVPMMALDTSGTADVPAAACVMRDDPETGRAVPLGVVGNHNSPIQNEQQAQLLMRILGLRHLRLNDAGYISDGREVFLVCDVPLGVVIDTGRLGDAPLRGPFELVSLNHHDGSGALWFYVLPAGTWYSTLRPLVAPLGQRQPGNRWIARHAVAHAHVRHNASLRGIAGKLRHDLGICLPGDGPIATL